MKSDGSALPSRIGAEDFRVASDASDASAPVPAADATPCPVCAGVGYYTERVPYGHPDFGKLFQCECKRVEREQRRYDELRRLSNLSLFEDKSFASFDAFIPGIRHAYQHAVAYARSPRGWLVLFGGYGTGKTHLAAAIANEALTRGISVLFVIVPDLLDHLRGAFGPQSQTSYDDLFARVREVPLLVLDDLGTENTTPWAREKLYQIVNHRYNAKLATVMTSNLRPEQIDGRIYSRMCDPTLSVVVRINAADYRRRDIPHEDQA